MVRNPVYFKDPLYQRWRTTVTRYCNKNNQLYLDHGMDPVWLPPDSKGFVAFKAWVEAELVKLEPTRPNIRNEFKIVRKDNNGIFGPSNCRIVHRSKSPKEITNECLDETNKALMFALDFLETKYGLRAPVEEQANA